MGEAASSGCRGAQGRCGRAPQEAPRAGLRRRRRGEGGRGSPGSVLGPWRARPRRAETRGPGSCPPGLAGVDAEGDLDSAALGGKWRTLRGVGGGATGRRGPLWLWSDGRREPWGPRASPRFSPAALVFFPGRGGGRMSGEPPPGATGRWPESLEDSGRTAWCPCSRSAKVGSGSALSTPRAYRKHCEK